MKLIKVYHGGTFKEELRKYAQDRQKRDPDFKKPEEPKAEQGEENS